AANYTWGKVLDNVTEGGLGDYLNTNGYGGLYSGGQDIQNQAGDRGPSEFDVAQRFALSAVWELPSPKSNAALKNVLGGWKLNSVISLQSGRPFDVYCGLAWYSGCDFNMDGLPYDRPNRPAGIKTTGFSNRQFVNGLFSVPMVSTRFSTSYLSTRGPARSVSPLVRMATFRAMLSADLHTRVWTCPYSRASRRVIG